MRMLIAALLLFNAASALGAPGASPSTQEQCRQERPLVRELWQRGLYDAPALAKHVVIAAISGDLADVRQSLDALPRSEVARWRQVAMYTAAEQGQSAVVDALLDDGADANGSAEMPPFTSAAYSEIQTAMDKDPRFGGAKAIRGMQALGIMNNDPRQSGPALLAAIACGDLATVEVLLRHHANPMARLIPGGADPFSFAIVYGEAEITQTLLSHGADPCAEDRRIFSNFERLHKPTAGHDVASIGKRNGFPSALVAGLECHSPAPRSPDAH
ncbi:MAG TPA: ankyrin repeat domain-containing protein [Rhodanobacteraceae bacterium]|nr:ankyrin repeat domain-containing protein [Rhodanobacteraceae bacterium]